MYSLFDGFVSFAKNSLRIMAQRTNIGKMIWETLAKGKAVFLNDRRDLWIPKNMGVSGFFEKLNEQECDYVVLRWFEELPDCKSIYDIDMLINDQSVSKVEGLLTRSPRKGLIKCDIYTTSQNGGFLYKDIIYYPETFSNEILKSKSKFKGVINIPSEQWYFNSLAYHAVYHKGELSGIASGLDCEKGPGVIQSKYWKKLEELKTKLSISVDMTLEGLHLYMSQQGLAPDVDILDRLGIENEFCSKLCDRLLDEYPVVRGGGCFVVRQPIESEEELSIIEEVLESSGFRVVCTNRLQEVAVTRVKTMLRGGNWGSIKSAYDGGDPMAIIVCFDPSPIPPSDLIKAKSRAPDNQRIFEAKYKVRDVFFRQVLHSADNSRQAAHYISIACPDTANQIMQNISELKLDKSEGIDKYGI
jgi:hypothetical protein